MGEFASTASKQTMSDLNAVCASLQGGFIAFLHGSPELALAVVVFPLSLLGARWLRNLIQRLTAKKPSNLGPVLGRLALGAILSVGTLTVLYAQESVLKEPAPSAPVVDPVASTVNVRARLWVQPRQSDILQSRSDVLISIKETFGEAGIDLSLPTNQILRHENTEERDGDRTNQREGWPAKKSGNARSRVQVLQKEQAHAGSTPAPEVSK